MALDNSGAICYCVNMTFDEFFKLADSVKPESVTLQTNDSTGGYVTWTFTDFCGDVMEITFWDDKDIIIGAEDNYSENPRWKLTIEVLQWIGMCAGFLDELED